jgi:DNA-binding HxlR family transcriptional regulator
MTWLFTSIAFFVAVITHGVLSHLAPRGSAVKRFFLIGALVGLLLIASFAVGNARPYGAVLAYALLCELYVFLFTLVANSVSLNIAMRLLQEGPMRANRITEIYSLDDMLERRLEQLVNAKLITRGSDGWRVTADGARIALVFNFMRAVFHQTKPGT